MDLLTTFLAQMSALPIVWMPFILALAIMAIVIWRILKHHYEGRISRLEQDVKSEQAEVSRLERRIQEGTDEPRVAELEARLARVLPLKLSEDQLQQLALVAAGAPGKIRVFHDMSFAAGQRIAGLICTALKGAGWDADTSTVGGITGPEGGFLLNVPSEQLTPSERCLKAAMSAIGLQVEVKLDDLEWGLYVTNPMV